MAANDTTRARRYYQRGVYYYERGRWSDAASNLRDALKIYPEHSRARLYLGAALARQKLYLDAVRVLEEGRHLPSVPDGAMRDLLRLLSIICMIRQDHPAAEYYLRRALELGAADGLLQGKLASVLCKAGDFEAGFDLFLQQARRAPRDSATNEDAEPARSV